MLKMDKIDDLCLWKDLFYLHEIEGTMRGISTFSGYKKWKETHPLYRCTTEECDGYDIDCKGYKSMKSINRDRDK